MLPTALLTSLFPISASLGSPTAVPCALTSIQCSGAVFLRESMHGVSALDTALKSFALSSPHPSITITRTGLSVSGIVGWGCSLKSTPMMLVI